MKITAEDYLISQNKEPKSQFKLGKVDSNYTTGRPRILFDGETQLSSKRYPYMESYTPKQNQRVLLAKVSGSYVIIGGVV